MTNGHPRKPEFVKKTLETIWYDHRLQCPVCAAPMNETDPYLWVCHTDHCPITSTKFNEVIHQYAARRNPY